MTPNKKGPGDPAMGRRSISSGEADSGASSPLSAPATVAHAAFARAAATEMSDIARRDHDLPFIGTEETFSTRELMALNNRLFLEDTGLAEIGPRRIAALDSAGIKVQVLSAHTPGVQNVPGQEGIDLAYRLNKMLADGPMATYRGRFQAFATLPLLEPEAAADELQRTVEEDGFLGCLTNGIIGKKFLDHPDFEPLLARAEALAVPIDIHPGLAPDEVFQIYYSNMRPEYQANFQDQVLSNSAYGWHQEVVTQCLRMVTSGVFDRYPGLQIIIGHMGEGLPFFYKRIAEKMGEVTRDTLNKPFEQYFQDNFWFTTSAFFQDDLLELLLKYVSVDRVMFATDYPFVDMKDATDWFRAVDLPRHDKEKIAFRNAENLFGMKV